ncbi:S-glutathionyl-(chloro)hydroquinone reductase [Paecilomyces lecythidis]|uniref:S-glutathionyl-(Chloro)hydroquinone reductase n=1 Tax=Paecilomyces lecythidis TaxID=3004212 RepID=A0ABR3X773_9EURO
MAPSNLWNERGELQRPATQFRDFISNDANARFPPEKGRYHLYVSYACPWAHRTLIVRKLKGLEDLITVTVVHYHMSLTDSWRFYTDEDETDDEDCCPDPLHTDTERLKELYLKAQPDYDGRFSVPVLWDRKLETIVSNESSEIIRMMYSAFDQLLPPKFQQVDLYPQVLRQEIDQTNEWTYDYINNGV